MVKPITTLAVAALLCSGLAAAQQQTQGLSLAEIAKKNKERKAKRVITDDDLPSTSQRAPEAAPAAAAASGEATAGANAPGGDGVAQADAKPAAKADGTAPPAESEEIKKLKERIQSLRDEEAGYTKTADEAQEKVNASTDEFRREMYSRVIANSRENARQLADQRQQLEGQLQAKQKSKANDGEGEAPAEAPRPPE